jgi:L-ascorbate metabolism protein UlaG (beta-lactamase superfamily)
MSEVLVLPRRNEDPDFGNGSVFFVGTATVLLRYAGFTILTDPNFLHRGDHVHLGYGLVSRRQTNPAVEIEDLPPLDFVLLSHMHGDHFDRVAERKLNKATPIVSTRHAVAYLRRKGFTATHALRTGRRSRSPRAMPACTSRRCQGPTRRAPSPPRSRP